MTATMTRPVPKTAPNILDELEALERSMVPTYRDVCEHNSRITMQTDSARSQMADSHNEAKRKAFAASITEQESQRIVYDPAAARDSMIKLTARRGELSAALTSVNSDMLEPLAAKRDNCMSPELFLRLQQCTVARGRIDVLLRRIGQSEAELGECVPPAIAIIRANIQTALKVVAKLVGVWPGADVWLQRQNRRIDQLVRTATWQQLLDVDVSEFSVSAVPGSA